MLAAGTVLLILCCVQSAHAVTCGTWSQNCQPFYPDTGDLEFSYVAGSIEFYGLTTGNFSWINEVFASSRLLQLSIMCAFYLICRAVCNQQPLLLIEAYGSWINNNQNTAVVCHYVDTSSALTCAEQRPAHAHARVLCRAAGRIGGCLSQRCVSVRRRVGRKRAALPSFLSYQFAHDHHFPRDSPQTPAPTPRG